MMFARSHAELHNVRRNVERIKKLSDNVVGIGPFGIGVDALVSWIPGVNALYSGIAGLMLVGEAVRARVPAAGLVKIGALIAVDTFSDLIPVPILPAVADTLFTAHKWSADTILNHMDDTIYIEGSHRDAKNKPEYHDLMGRVRSGQERRRVIFLD
jgi:hypothetical protein